MIGSFTLDPVFANVALASVAIVTLIGALAKACRFSAFEQSVASFRLVPHALLLPVALAVPACEALAVLALLAPSTRTAGSIALAALFALFACALAINVARGHTAFDCGCSGFVASNGEVSSGPGAPGRIGWAHVGRALALAVLAAFACVPQAARDVVWFDYLSVFGGTLVAVIAWLTVDVLLVNRPKLNHLRNT